MEANEIGRVKSERTSCATQDKNHKCVNQTFTTDKVENRLETNSVPQDVQGSYLKQNPSQEVSRPSIRMNNRTRRPAQYIIVPAPGKAVNRGIMQPFSLGPWGHYNQPFIWRGNSSAMMHAYNTFGFPRPRPFVRPIYKYQRPINPDNFLKGQFEKRLNSSKETDSAKLKQTRTTDERGANVSGLIVRDVNVETAEEEEVCQLKGTGEENIKISALSKGDKRVGCMQANTRIANGNMQFWNTLGITKKFGGAAEEIVKCVLRLSNERENEKITSGSKMENMLHGNITLESTEAVTIAPGPPAEPKQGKIITKYTDISQNVTDRHVNQDNSPQGYSIATTGSKETNTTESISIKTTMIDTMLGRPVKLETIPAASLKQNKISQQPIKVEPVVTETIPATSLKQKNIPQQPIKAESVVTETIPATSLKQKNIPQQPIKAEPVSKETIPAASIKLEIILQQPIQAEPVTTETIPATTTKLESIPQQPINAERVATATIRATSIKLTNIPQQPIKAEPVGTDRVNNDSVNDRKDADSATVQVIIKPAQVTNGGTQTDYMLEGLLQGLLNATTAQGDVPNGMVDRPKALLSSSDTNELAGSMSTKETPYRSIQPSLETVEANTDHLLPGTDHEYRTPGTNKINKNGKIKRPMNAFMVWARTYRAKVAVEFPRTTNSEVSVRLGQVWNEMTPDQKKPYYLEADRIKQRHRMQYPGWCYTPTPARRNPPPQPPPDTVAHNIYWARYSNGTIIKSLPSLPQSAKIEPETSSAFSENSAFAKRLGERSPITPTFVKAEVDQSISASTCVKVELDPSCGVPTACRTEVGASMLGDATHVTEVTTPMANVYKPVPFHTPLFQPNVSTIPTNVKLEKADTVAEKKTEPKTAVNLGDCCTKKANCQCFLHRNSKKRPRKPRVRRKDRQTLDECTNQFTSTKKQIGKVTKGRGRNMKGVLRKTKEDLMEDVRPVDPYNPFYLLNLQETYDEASDDIDIDSWQTYLGDNRSLPVNYSQEPRNNLDVFLSEARVSQSTTSVGSSDIEILPTPVASTLDRLQGPPIPTNREIPDPLNQVTFYQDTSKQNTTLCDEYMFIKGAPSPQGNDLFVINEEIVETTPHKPQARGLGEADTGGAGDSSTLDKLKHFQIQQAETNSFPRLEDEVPSVSPPGKRLCV